MTLFKECGVDNLDCYDAIVREVYSNAEHHDYKAVNLIGAVRAADLDKSKYLLLDPDDKPLDDTVFDKLIADEDKAKGHLFIYTEYFLRKKIRRKQTMDYLKPIRFFIVLGMALTLAACGSSSGDSGTANPAIPAIPTNVSVTAGDSQLTVSWNPVSEATSYNLYWSTSGGVTTSYNFIPNVTSPYDHSGLSNGTTYYYVVTAVNTAGESSPSSEISATPEAVVANTYTVGGSVSGLTGTGLVLQNNGGDNLSVSAGATLFTFTTPIADGATYVVTVSAQPSGQTCTITNGSGTINGANVTNVSVSCSNNSSSVRKVPDTGQTTSYTETFGEDSDYTINPPSYTDNGDGTLTDNTTSLIWQQEDDNTIYDWYEATGTADATYNPGGATDVCGSLTLAGYTDWRLPSKKELMSIVNYDMWTPAIDATYFPNTDSSYYWSSTTYVGSASYAWGVAFGNGVVYGYGKAGSYDVRCVRLEQNPAPDFTDNGDFTVTDNITTLMWQKEDDDTPRTWEDAITYCEGLSLAEYADWRLPNEKELESITDNSTVGPAIDATYFPNTNSSYWSSTSNKFNTSDAWYVNFISGGVYSYSKTSYSYANYIRCVRLGQ